MRVCATSLETIYDVAGCHRSSRPPDVGRLVDLIDRNDGRHQAKEFDGQTTVEKLLPPDITDHEDFVVADSYQALRA